VAALSMPDTHYAQSIEDDCEYCRDDDRPDFLRAQSRSAVVMALGTMKNAAGMRSTLPMLSFVAQGNGEAMVVPKMRTTTDGSWCDYQADGGHDDKGNL
jgi:hypothetical protein